MSDKPGEWNEKLQRYNPLTGEPPASERMFSRRPPNGTREARIWDAKRDGEKEKS